MDDGPKEDWDPRAPAVLDDAIAAYDRMRQECPVAYSKYLGWSLFRHADVMRAVADHETFSNVVSSHRSVPNSMDPPEHTRYRRIIDAYFTVRQMSEFEPVCRDIADSMVDSLLAQGELELMSGFSRPFALRIQCAFMGWPDHLQEPLNLWVRRNHQATLAGDREVMRQLADEFDAYIREQLDMRRRCAAQGPPDVTGRLQREKIDGRVLSDEEIFSIVRNWTVGELGTIAASVGILVHYLAEQPLLQQALRQQPGDLPEAIDEILRIHAPLVSNRRQTTRDVEIGGRRIKAGERVSLNWAAANRDPEVFGNPDDFQPRRKREQNLLYGAGLHVCPGAPLARMELRLLMDTLLRKTRRIALVPHQACERAQFPAGGFSRLPVVVS
ncbi:MAG: cytochrome P450 [Pseudomonadales bacterium]|nr:cytochrome P450 [Pseudomonadales bacterium]